MKVEAMLGLAPAEIAKIFAVSALPITCIDPPDGDKYLELEAHGVSFVLNGHLLVSHIQLYSSEFSKKYKEYKSPLPFGFSFNSSRADVRATLGLPSQFEEGGDGKGMFGKYLYPWDKFISDNIIYHFEYNKSERIRLISVSDNRD